LGNRGTLHTFFTIKSDDGEVDVKCDFLCYVGLMMTFWSRGEFRVNQPRVSSYKIEEKYFDAKVVENKTLNLNFKQP
jgi:hypothetical protein